MRGKKTGGRGKGVLNKTTKALKETILGALDEAGGQAYLAKQAEANPVAFMTLLGKVLPSEVKAEHTGPNGESLPVPTLGDFYRSVAIAKASGELNPTEGKN